ncbi:MAG TPA: hypothetical protein VFB32_02990 [Rudaea sp.]|nr:hypothetical protein [Rudaea sp.]
MTGLPSMAAAAEEPWIASRREPIGVSCSMGSAVVRIRHSRLHAITIVNDKVRVDIVDTGRGLGPNSEVL